MSTVPTPMDRNKEAVYLMLTHYTPHKPLSLRELAIKTGINENSVAGAIAQLIIDHKIKTVDVDLGFKYLIVE